MPKFQMGVRMNLAEAVTARVADGTGAANQLDKADNGKFVKLVADSRYGLCAVGNEIEGVLNVANDIPPADGFNLGSVQRDRNQTVKVTLDGLQATPGTGTVAVGDYVVCGTVVARGTALNGANPKVCKATAAATAIVFKWRVVAILNGGTGAVGDTAIIERV